jgi:hypothetical protein
MLRSMLLQWTKTWAMSPSFALLVLPFYTALLRDDEVKLRGISWRQSDRSEDSTAFNLSWPTSRAALQLPSRYSALIEIPI